MPKPWKDVEASPAFLALPHEEKIAARDEYFNSVVAPRISPAERDAVFEQFKTRTRLDSGVMSSMGRSFAQGATDVGGMALQGTAVTAARESLGSARRKAGAIDILDIIDSTPDMDDAELDSTLRAHGLGGLSSPPTITTQTARLGIMASPSPDFDAAAASAEQQQIHSYIQARRAGNVEAAQAIREQLRAKQFSAEEGSLAEKYGVYEAGEAVRDFGRETFPVTPEERDRWYNKYIATPAGQTTAFAVGGLATGPAAPATIAGTGAMVGGQGGYEDAMQHGASNEQALDAAGINILAGTSEALPIQHAFRAIPGLGGIGDDLYEVFKKGGWKEAGKFLGRNIAAGVVEEGAQEAFQQLAQNYAAGRYYDPDRPLTAGVGESAAEGGGAGGALAALASFLPGRRRGQPGTTDAAPTIPPPDAAAPPAQPTPQSPSVQTSTPPLDATGLPAVDLPQVSPEAAQVYQQHPGGGIELAPGAAPGQVPPVTPGQMQQELEEVVNTDRPISEIIDERDFPDKKPNEEVIFVDEGEGTDATGYAYLNKDTGEVRYPGAPEPMQLTDQWQEVPEGAVLPGGAQVQQVDETGRRRARMVAESSPSKPIKAETAEDIAAATSRAASSPENDLAEPTDGQKEAGNYKKGHVNIQGLNITIETPRGGVRTGLTSKGERWQVDMPADYGYIKRSEGADGEQVDVYIGRDPKSDTVFVLNQLDADTGKFDEHKVFIGFDNEQQLREVYEGAFSDGRAIERVGGAQRMTMAKFKEWLKTADTTKPVGRIPTAEERMAFLESHGYTNEEVMNRLGDEAAAAVKQKPQASEFSHLAKKVDGMKIPQMQRRLQSLDNKIRQGVTPTTAEMFEWQRLKDRLDDAGEQYLPPKQTEAETASAPEAPRYTVKTADIEITRSGVRAVPHEPEAPAMHPGLAKSMEKLKAAIENKDVDFLNNALGNLDNKNMRAAFTEQTGIALPKTVGGTKEALVAWAQKRVAARSLDQILAGEQKPAIDEMAEGESVAENADNVQKPAENVQTDAIDALHEHFAEQFRQGRVYPSIQQARKDASAIVGKPIHPNTEEAKRVDEQIEAGVVMAARDIVESGGTVQEIYDKLVDLYEKKQPAIAQRSSTSAAQQAYSTPAPVSYLASRLANISAGESVLEPTAGNGALLVEATPSKVKAVELNPGRVSMLQRMFPDMTVIEENFLRLPVGAKQFDRVIANPPFGNIPDGGLYRVGNRETKELDQAIALKALSYMKDDGRAVLILGSKRGLAQSDKAALEKYNGDNARLFYKHLYDNYRVTDHFTLDGDLYKKQGAGYPIDVIVINGRGKSDLDLPGYKLPRLYSSLADLKGLLDEGTLHTERQQVPGAADREQPVGASEQAGIPGRDRVPPARPDRQVRPGGSEGSDRILVVRPDTAPAEQPASVGRSDNEPAARRGSAESGSPGQRTVERAGEAAAESGTSAAGRVAEPSRATDSRPQRRITEETVSESGLQVTYQPTSRAKALDTLVPIKQKVSIDRALANIEADVGDVDAYVAEQLDYDSTEELHKYFGAEQVEALALAIRNIEKNAGFIIGDQTGIGKGRVNAGILRYARVNGKVPMFVTKQPGLYADMYRDLAAIGEKNIKAFITNSDVTGDQAIFVQETGDTIKSLTPAAYKKALADITATGKLPEGFNYLFTTYSQMQPVAGKATPRHAALESVAEGAIIAFDESHEAGGQAKGTFKIKKKDDDGKPVDPRYESRAKFTRHIVDKAEGVMYSSATFAKNPDVMDLYRKTDIRLGVDNTDDLANTIRKGGVPLQQVLSNMLVEAGQYVRREKSFDGVTMDLVKLDADLVMADRISSALRRIFAFDVKLNDVRDAIKEGFKQSASAMGRDNAISEAGISSTNFSSIMHNIVAQALVAAKIKQVAKRVIEQHSKGIKPVIAVSGTNESFLRDYMEGNDLKVGDDASGLTFNRLFERYLERTRMMTQKDSEGNKTPRPITDSDIRSIGGEQLLEEYNALMDSLGKEDFGDAPVSPIDYLRYELGKAGVRVGELTGREYILNYKDGGKAVIAQRKSSDAQKKKDINSFNSGDLDAVILNRSGSTGFSMHAAKEFKDQKPRRMTILQAEPDINVYMQMLGRIHRTGQVVLPSYDIAISNIPVERRPAAVLMKKLASLNANTSANKKGATTIEEVTDFMNHYGDLVTAELLKDEPELRKAIDIKLPADEDERKVDGLASKVTGRLAILPVKEQERILTLIEQRYRQFIAYLDSIGENALEARELDLQAEVKGIVEIERASGESPFTDAVRLEQVSAKRLGKPYTMEQVQEKINEALDGRTRDEYTAALRKEYMEDTGEEWKRYEQRMDAARGERAEKEEKERKRFEDVKALRGIILEALDDHHLGDIVTLKGDEGNLHGIVIGIKRDQTTSPIALSQFSFRIALADASREITVPLSQVVQRPGQEGQPKYLLTTSHMSRDSITDEFARGQREIRETRYIATGNLFKAFDKFKQGKIIFYTKNDGSKAQGILMPMTFQPDEELKRLSVKLDGAAEAKAILTEYQDAEVITIDDLVTIDRDARDPGNYRLTVSRRGRRYYTSPKVTAAVGDLYSRTGDYRTSFAPEKLPALFKAIQDEGGNWAVKKHQDFIRKRRGEGSILKFQTEKVSLSGTGKGRARIFTKIEWNEQHKKLAADLTRLAKERFGDGLKLEFAELIYDQGGMQAFGAYKPANIPGSNGALEHIAYISLSPRAKDPLGALNHEGIHYLRQTGIIDDHTWSVLERRAKSEWIDKYNIKNRYPDGDQALWIEEAIAEAYADRAKWNTLPQTVRVFFKKLLDFFEAVKKMLVGRGFDSTDKIFDEISAGAMASRPASNEAEKADMRYQVAPPVDSPAFKRWFGDSKVVDKDGRPLVVYKGMHPYDWTKEDSAGNAPEVTSIKRTSPFPSYHGDEPGIEVAGFFGSKEVANRFSSTVSKVTAVYPVYLSLQNPYIVDAKGKRAGEIQFGELGTPFRAAMRADKYDGAIIKNTSDEGTVYVAKRAGQIKSAFNVGTFDAENPDIKFQAARPKQKAAPLTLLSPDDGVIDAITDANRTLVEKVRALGKGEHWQASLDTFRRYMQDRFLHFYRVQKKIEELTGRPLGEGYDVYGAEEMFTGRAGEKLQRLELRHKEPIISKISDFNNKHQDGLARVEAFLYALHATERNAQIAKINPKMPDGGSGMTNQEAAEIIAQAKKDGVHDDLMDIARMVHAMLRESLKHRVEMGLITQKFADTLEDTYKWYVPLRGVGEIGDDSGMGMKTGKGQDVRGREFQRARGRKSLAPDVLANAFAIADESIIRGEKNRVGQALYKLVTTYPAPDIWEVAKPALKPVLNATTGLIEYRALPLPKNLKLNDNTLGVKVNGVQKLITLKDKRLATPIKNLEMDRASALFRFLMAYNGFLSRMYTMFDPEFIIKNAFRDIQTAAINLTEYDKKGLVKAVARDYGKALKAGFGAVRGKADTEWQKYFREYAAAGGKVSFFHMEDLQARRTRLVKEIKLREGGIWNMSKRGVREFIEFVEMSNQAIENAVRLSAFVNARRRGMSDQEAARLAKNLTVNFNKKGEWGPKMNATYLFFNASIQGAFRIFGALRSKNVQKIVGAVIAMGFAEEMMNAMLSPDDDDGEPLYDKIPEYVKESNIVIIDPTGALTTIVNKVLPTGQIKGVHYIKIPMAYGYRVFHELGRTTAATARGKSSVTESMANMAYSIVNNFNPVGGHQTLLNFLAPTILDPIVDLYNNKNFAGNRIYPEVSQFDKSPPPASERYFPNVSDASRVSAAWLNSITGGDKITPGAVSITPEVLDYFFASFTGSAGAFVGRTVDAVSKGFTGEEIAIGDVPFARQMFGAQQPWFDKNAAYDRMSEIDNITGRIDSYAKAGEQAKARELKEAHRAVLAQEGAAKFTRKQLTDLRKKRLFYEFNKAYTAEQKEQHIKRVQEREKEVVNEFNRRYLKAIQQDKGRE